MAVATSIVFGLAPAVGISGVAPNEAIKEQSRGLSSDSRFSVRNALVVVQVALSLTLVVAAGLFARTFFSLTTRDAGFDRDPILLVNVDVQQSGVRPEERHESVRAAAAVGGGSAWRGAGGCVVYEPARQRRLEHGGHGARGLDVDAAPADVLGQRGQRRLVRTYG